VTAFAWYWCARLNQMNGTTALGRMIARAGRARLRPGPYGTILAEGYRWRFPVAGAFTVGSVILTRGDIDTVAQTLPEVMEHERRHCVQYAVLGLGFLPLYLVSCGWSWVCFRDVAQGNVFERWAGLRSGGYE